MDRQTLANAATRITREFQLDQEHYGNLELVFGWAFAVGSLLFGIAADRVSVRWLYPVVLLLWSAVGLRPVWQRTTPGCSSAGRCSGCSKAATGRAQSRLPAPAGIPRSGDGNSVLQSGTSIGAILAPLLMRAMLTDAAGSWRLPFQVVGAVGLFWIVLWFALVGNRISCPARPRVRPEALRGFSLSSLGGRRGSGEEGRQLRIESPLPNPLPV